MGLLTGKRWWSKFGGIFSIHAGGISLFWFPPIRTFLHMPELKGDHVLFFASPFPLLGLAVGFGGNVLLSNIMGVIFIFSIFVSIAGGIFFLKRKMWRLALAGSIAAMICSPGFGIAALIFTLKSREQFPAGVRFVPERLRTESEPAAVE